MQIQVIKQTPINVPGRAGASCGSVCSAMG